MINHPNLLLLHPISADDVVNFHRRGLERRSAQMGAVSVPGGFGLSPLLDARKSASAALSLAVVTGAPPSIAAPMPEATTGSRSDS